MMNTMFGLFNLGGGEIILILALVLILFGARKLPELAKGLGQGIKEFKKATREVTDEVQRSMDDNHSQYNPPAPKQIQDPPVEPQKTAEVPQSVEKKG
jgi:sec-independent protein translocase protein TatA